MQKWVWKFVCAMLTLVAFAIPIERKYDKAFRFFSKSLIPEHLSLPSWFDTKIYYYPSDLVAPFLILVSLFVLKIPLRKLFIEKGALLLWFLIAMIAISITTSPLSHYALLYTRLWQWGTGAFLFGLLASMDDEHRLKLTKWILLSMIAMALFQSTLAIAQYFHQGSFGLKFLGETNFSPNIQESPHIYFPNGARWIFDTWMEDTSPLRVVRAMGTTPHPNVLGGFLCLTGLASLSFFSLSSRKWLWCGSIFLQFFALALTYSRGALFSYLIGVAIWLGLNFSAQNKKHLLKTVLLVGSISLITVLCLHQQLGWRGGVFGSSKLSIEADAFRENLENLSWKMIDQKPFSGIGFQQFSIRAPEFINPENQPSRHINGVHNIYLILTAESGIISLICFLTFAGLVLWSATRAEFSPYLASLISMFIALLLIGTRDFYPIQFQIGKLLFFITAGLIASHKRRESVAVPI